jgi:hypothetical protein
MEAENNDLGRRDIKRDASQVADIVLSYGAESDIEVRRRKQKDGAGSLRAIENTGDGMIPDASGAATIPKPDLQKWPRKFGQFYKW